MILRFLPTITLLMIGLTANAQSTLSTISPASATEQYATYNGLMERDVAWKKKVFRDADLSDNNNRPLFMNGNGDDHCALAGILVDGVRNGKIKAYSPKTENFNYTLTADEVNDILKNATEAGNLVSADKISRFRIKEDWLFVDKDKPGHMEVRILGLAPCASTVADDGTATIKPLFWIYYPDAKAYLAAHQMATTSKDVQPVSWDDMITGRKFSSKIISVGNASERRAVPPDADKLIK